MIKSKTDLQTYLACERKKYMINSNNLGICLLGWVLRQMFLSPIGDEWYIWQYIKTLRETEFYLNKRHNPLYYIMKIYSLYKLRRISRITGFQIPPYVFGKGITIYHWGSIIVNANVRIGDNCTIYPNVLIGHKIPGQGCPKIGDNCFLCAGAKIIGNITIGDNVTIAHNTVVVKDVPSGCIVAGNPARIIKQNSKKCNKPL